MLCFQPWFVPGFLSAGPSHSLRDPPLAKGPQAIVSLPAKGWELVGSQELVKVAVNNGCTDRGFGLCVSIPPCLPVHPVMFVCPSRHAGLQHPPARCFAEVVMSCLKQGRAVPRAALKR